MYLITTYVKSLNIAYIYPGKRHPIDCGGGGGCAYFCSRDIAEQLDIYCRADKLVSSSHEHKTAGIT